LPDCYVAASGSIRAYDGDCPFQNLVFARRNARKRSVNRDCWRDADAEQGQTVKPGHTERCPAHHRTIRQREIDGLPVRAAAWCADNCAKFVAIDDAKNRFREALCAVRIGGKRYFRVENRLTIDENGTLNPCGRL
jgi:hypothetical protein